MRKAGRVVRFDAARGFGFIRCADSEADVFFHVRDFASAGQPPVEGLAVVYEEIHVGGKGPRAMAVRTSDAFRPASTGLRTSSTPRRRPDRPAQAPAPESGRGWVLMWMVVYGGVLLWAGAQQRLPVWVLLALPLVNLLTFGAYWRDKQAARKGAWRTSENDLHLLSLAGGWPAAWFAQQVLRHKSRKQSFRQNYRMTVFVHLLAVALWLWGAGLLRMVNSYAQ